MTGRQIGETSAVIHGEGYLQRITGLSVNLEDITSMMEKYHEYDGEISRVHHEMFSTSEECQEYTGSADTISTVEGVQHTRSVYVQCGYMVMSVK